MASLQQHIASIDQGLAADFVDRAARPKLLSDLAALIAELVASDALAKASIEHARGLPVTPPKGGMIQLGFVLYWIEYPPAALQQIVDQLPERARRVWKLLQEILIKAHPPTVTKSDYEFMQNQLRGQGIIGPDGQILGEGEYQGADASWLWAFFDYVINLVDRHDIAPFSTDPKAQPFDEPLAGGDTVRIAVIGDWGTGHFDGGGGYDPAASVLDTVNRLTPPADYIIHLGDVYYAGTQDRLPLGEEYRHLLELWPPTPPKRSFTLNSNHEMYGGAQGYFNVALGRGGGRTPFAHQNGLSYFALTRGDWAFVGLDAAYFDPSPLYMTGGLGSRGDDPQYDFLSDIARRYANVVIFSHQTAMSMDGTQPLPLWQDVTSVLPAGQIKYWYWGHIHLGIVYGGRSALGRAGVAARCAGHSAIPIGAAWGLTEGDGVIDWYAKTPVGAGAYPNRVRNGFALLTLTGDSVSEAFYDAGDARTPVWTPAS